MQRVCWLLVFLIGLGICAVAEDKGLCPQVSPDDVAKASRMPVVPPPPTTESKFAGTVLLIAGITDGGSVCSVQLIKGFDQTADAQAMRAVRDWHVEPLKKDGHAIPTVAKGEITFWKNANSEFIAMLLALKPLPTNR